MDGSSALSAVSSVLGATFRIVEKGYEIKAVDDQARSLLRTVDQVSGQLRDASSLRRQKSALFTKLEKRMIDDTIQYTEEAISLVATLVEPVRADMEVSGGSIRFPTRLLFVLRDSPRIQVCLTQLGIASQSLNRDITILSGRTGRFNAALPPEIVAKPAPPSYDEVVFLTERRQLNSRRRGSALSLPSILSKPQAATTTSLGSSQETGTETLAVQEMVEVDQTRISENTEHFETAGMSERASSTHSEHIRPPDWGQHERALSRGRQRSLRWLETRSQS